MAQKLEDVKRGGGSIRVGSTGTISSLMNKELDSSSSSQSVSVSVSGNDSSFKLRKSMEEAQSSSTKHRSPENTRRSRGPTTPKRQKQKASPEEASGGGSRDGFVRRIPEFPWKTRVHKRTHRVPMLGSENVAVDKTPKREKAARKVCIVEVVDTNCGVPAGSLSNRLKKLGFSKLSRSIV